jgi:5-methyltetrahydrofolate--homocysteine methyltransferase
MTEEIKSAVLTGNTYDIEEIIQSKLDSGVDAMDCLQAMIDGLEESGHLFQEGKYYLPELTMAGDTFKTGIKTLEPHLAGVEREYSGTVILGTIHGDVHDIGKNLVGFMLESAGYKVIDLGLDVSAERFLESIEEHSADVLGISALLTTTMLGMNDVVQAAENAGKREKVKIIIGGAPVSRKFAEEIGADAYGADAPDGLRIINSWMRDKDSPKGLKTP